MPKQGYNVIEIKNQVLGGISDSKYLGIENSVAKMVGFDIHGEPGVMKVNQKLTKISGSTIDELCKHSVTCSNGETYFFSADSGKIWRIKSDFTVSLAYTTVAEDGESKCLGAEEYNEFILWFTETRVHRIAVATALSESTWSTVDLNWNDFAVGDLEFHPSVIQNDVLYIGDNYEVAALEDESWTPTGALNIQIKTGGHRISAMMNFLTGILIGTVASSDIVNSIIALWNTWSTHITGKDELPEQGVNAFLKMDNASIASCGKKGNFYLFNGSFSEQFKRVPGDWSGTKEAIVNSGSNANRFGMPLFGISNVSGNPADQGIYSFGSYSAGYRKVINLEWLISTGKANNVEIGAIALVGYDMLVSWKDNNNTPSYGVDKLDHSNKYSGAYFETRIIKLDPDQEKEFDFEAYYRLLPTNTDITLKVSINNGAFASIPNFTLKNDTLHKRKYNSFKIKASTVQFRVITSASGNNAPEFDLIIISYPS